MTGVTVAHLPTCNQECRHRVSPGERVVLTDHDAARPIIPGPYSATITGRAEFDIFAHGPETTCSSCPHPVTGTR